MSGTRNPFNLTVEEPKGIFASKEMLKAAFEKREQERIAKMQDFLDKAAVTLSDVFEHKLADLRCMRKRLQEVEAEFAAFVRAMLYAEDTGNIGPALIIAAPSLGRHILYEQGFKTPEEQAPFITVPADWVAPDRRVQI